MKTGPLTSSIALTENEQQVLLWLLHHPLQRIRDVAIGLALSESTTARILQRLGREQLVEQVTACLRISHRHSWYHLSSAGIILIATWQGTDPVLLARAWQTDERHLLRLLPRLHQIIHLQDIVHSLMSHAPIALARAGYQAEIRWGWQREYRITFRKRRQVIHCKTDAVVVFRRSYSESRQEADQFFTLFVYLDLGQTSAFTDHTAMVRISRNLLLYRESRERQPYRSMFPSVLIVVESARQLELWQQAMLEAARQLNLSKPLAGVIVNLAAEQTMIERSSLWNLNWRHLITNASCRLQEILVPMQASAVPAGIITHRVMGPMTEKKGTWSPNSHPIKGHYQQRVEALLDQPDIRHAHNLSQEREIIALLSLEMSHRYREILLMLYTHPLLSIEELAIFSSLHPPTAYRYVLELSRWGCLEDWRSVQGLGESGEASRPGRKKEEVRWALGGRGLLYLAASTATPVRKLYNPAKGERLVQEQGEKTPVRRVWQRGVGQLYREWKHTRGVYQCVVAFHREALLQPNHRIAWFETHFRCARHYQINKKWHNFRPDAVLEYVVNSQEHTHRFHFWIEWDGGTMGSNALREKWRTYQIYMRSLEWRTSMSRGVQPLLLIIVPNCSQQDRVTRLVQEVFGSTTSLYVRVTTQDLLYVHGPLARIWTEIVPRPTERHLRALLDLQRTNE